MATALIALLVMLLMLCPWFNITTKTVTGIDDVSKEEIISKAGLEGGEINLFAFNGIKAKKELMKIPYIKDVKITRKLPNTIIISVTQRQIRGYVPYLKNYLYIDDDGVVLDVKDSYTKPCPVVVGLDFNTFSLGDPLVVKNTKSFNTIVELSKLMTKYNLLEDVIRVDVSDPEDIHLFINNVDVFFGDLTDSNRKIGYLNEIIKTIPAEDKGFLHLENTNIAPRFEYLT